MSADTFIDSSVVRFSMEVIESLCPSTWTKVNVIEISLMIVSMALR